MLSISVIIPSYNRVHLIERAVASALEQTRPPLEVIVVDDGSSDGTRELVEAIAARDPRVVGVFPGCNRGPAVARNLGIAVASGDLIAFLDSDDTWQQQHLETCARFFADAPGLDVVFTDIRTISSEGHVICPSMAHNRRIIRFLEGLPGQPTRYVFRVPEADAIIEQYFLGIQATVLRREAALAHPFDAALWGGEDLLFFATLALEGKKFGYIDIMLCEMLIHDGNLVSGKTNGLRNNREWTLAYSKMRENPAVTAYHRRMLTAQIARHQFIEGYLNFRRGARLQAINAYWRSLRTQFSWRAIRGVVYAAVLPHFLVHCRHAASCRAGADIETCLVSISV